MPLGVCAHSMFGVDRICAVPVWSVFEMSPIHRCADSGAGYVHVHRGVYLGVTQSSLSVKGCRERMFRVGSMSPSHRCVCRSPPRCHPVIAVPIGACGQRMFRVDRIYAALLWSVVAMSPSHRCAYKGL